MCQIAFASYPAALILLGTLRVFCGRKKLPFAGYSIVKEPKCYRLTLVCRNFVPAPMQARDSVRRWRIPGSNR